MTDKKKRRRKLARNIFIAGVAVGAGAAYYYSQRPIRDYEEKEVEIPSRRSAIIRATVIIPQTSRKMPLVIFAHGFGAERTEGSRFTLIAKNIARNDIASIMMDFSGCGKSDEDYTAYCLSNNLTDMECCLAYMKENYRIDEK